MVAETPRPRRPDRARSAATSTSCTTSGRSTDNAVDVLTRLGADIADDELEKRRTTATPARPRHADLHLRHDRPAQGLHAHARQLHVRARRRRRRAGRAVPRAEGASTLLFLPLAHVFARIIQVGCVKSRARLGHSADIKNLLPDLAEFQPTFILAVPRVFEKVFNTASQRATADGRGKIFDRAAETAIAYSRGIDARQDPAAGPGPARRRSTGSSTASCAPPSAASASTPSPAARRSASGSATSTAASGSPSSRATGSPRPRRRSRVNLPDAPKIGTVGRPLPGTAVRVADDGELLFRGGQVFAGYWRNDEATAEVMESDGWFHTGDLGEVDDEGFVRITGRKKEILVTAGGKNVAPAVLEDRLRGAPAGRPVHRRRRRPAVHRRAGHARPRLGPGLGRAARQEPATSQTWLTTPDLRAEVEAAVEDANKAVSKAESIRKFTILAGRLDRGGRPADPEPQAQAQRRDARAQGRGRRALRRLTRSTEPLLPEQVQTTRHVFRTDRLARL